MSFRFNEQLFRDPSFNYKVRSKLTAVLSKALGTSAAAGVPSAQSVRGSCVGDDRAHRAGAMKPSDILKSDVKINMVDFPTVPQVEILDLDITTQPRSLVKGICKLSCRDAKIQLETVIEANLMMVVLGDSPEFVTPQLVENSSFKVPITMTFSNVRLEAITNIFMRNYGVSISFNDVSLDFDFDCSIKILQTTIEKRLKESMHTLFKEVLPSVIFNTSQNWFHNNAANSPAENLAKTVQGLTEQTAPCVTFDETDFAELSPKNMLRLSTIVSSRHTLSLHGTSELHKMANITGCLEKQNLYRFISRMPSLTNYYMPYYRLSRINYSQTGNKDNLLPEVVLRERKYDLTTIIDIQNKLYERSYTDDSKDSVKTPRRRVIKLGKKKRQNDDTVKQTMQRTPAPTALMKIPTTPLTSRYSSPEAVQGHFPKSCTPELTRPLYGDLPLEELIIPKAKEKITPPRRISSPSVTNSIYYVGISNSTGHKWGSQHYQPHKQTVSPTVSPPPYTVAH
ncbi:ERMES complex subunit MDM34 KNAG_0B00510 [Huiozyma naganishii CBS 8797]|uniref:SMP-LTD domain-containing protein n=1 Tax=Huiozyma naganishii (strain ATCC MYA-139 / BCRC 22969 / CBS 8797 / KCTC 17520 / NBRC 10181 / NCYC 3082 / Yp74L-3) TaxID=1071383 RepID=J7R144_HUIN7|nr:hypothetical protein KNAG_0B00510 [Kazachstania naganishii CBS 8797]CCK68500.1 hypothetical protein KNAG_0B00510 [Kazachstania naganishii CBS 8797]